jgi:hypothetical protein
MQQHRPLHCWMSRHASVIVGLIRLVHTALHRALCLLGLSMLICVCCAVHCPVPSLLCLQYVVETRFVGERELGTGHAEIVDVKERIVEVAQPGPTCPANTGRQCIGRPCSAFIGGHLCCALSAQFGVLHQMRNMTRVVLR